MADITLCPVPSDADTADLRLRVPGSGCAGVAFSTFFLFTQDPPRFPLSAVRIEAASTLFFQPPAATPYVPTSEVGPTPAARRRPRPEQWVPLHDPKATGILLLQERPRRAQLPARQELPRLPTLGPIPAFQMLLEAPRALRRPVPWEGVQAPSQPQGIVVPATGYFPPELRRFLAKQTQLGWEVQTPLQPPPPPAVVFFGDGSGAQRRTFRLPVSGQLVSGVSYPVVGLPNWYLILLDD